jgi:SARP family transcriptional regulator, regulator of embCAB operon
MDDVAGLRVRLLGDLEVCRADGSLVTADQWRTAKTVDLLRLLALGNGQVVRSSSLMERLWPAVSADRARASLRTATSHIRRAIGAEHVVRRLDGLTLQDAWVDTHAFVHGVRRAQQAAREGRAGDVVAIAHMTDALYRGDFHAHDDDSDWAITERNHLVRSRWAMLTEAADAALEIGQPRDALDFAQASVALDRTSETAHRALMRAHAELGEIGSALRVFESYRTQLADELGADPSRQTLDLHLQLLRASER